MSDKNANCVTDAPTLRRVWNDYKQPRPWERIPATHIECNSLTLELTSARPRSHAWKHANTRRLSRQRGLLSHWVFLSLSLSDGYFAALGSVKPDTSLKYRWVPLTHACLKLMDWSICYERAPMFVCFVFMQILLYFQLNYWMCWTLSTLV